MTLHGRCANLKFEIHQLDGDCFHFYIRTPEMWNGIRRIFHMHEGPCNSSCEPCCDGYDEQATVALLLVKMWVDQALPKCKPLNKDRKSLDAIVADIASGLTKKRRARRRA